MSNATPGATSNAAWRIYLGGSDKGPYSLSTLRDLLADPKVGWGTPVWRAGMSDWRPAREVDELVRAMSASSAGEIPRPTLQGTPSFVNAITVPGASGLVSPPRAHDSWREPEGVLPQARYQIIRELRRGGMGQLLLASDRGLSGRVVVLKRILPSRSDEQLEHQFLREAVLTSRFNHPNIIKVFDIGRVEIDGVSSPYYTMPCVLGQDRKPCAYADIVETLTRDERIGVLYAAAKGVAHAHGQHLWHRDLKPENILLGEGDEVCVIDWGLVSVEPGKDYRYDDVPVLTQAVAQLPRDTILVSTSKAVTLAKGQTMGTPPYMAPEQFMASERCGSKADAWAFGVMLYQALTLRHPFGVDPEDNVVVAMSRVVGSAPPDPRRVRADVPEQLATLTLGLLAQVPEERLSVADFVLRARTWLRRDDSAPVLLHDLERPTSDPPGVSVESTPAIAVPTLPSSSPPRRRGVPLALWLGAAGLMAVAALAMAGLSRPHAALLPLPPPLPTADLPSPRPEVPLLQRQSGVSAPSDERAVHGEVTVTATWAPVRSDHSARADVMCSLAAGTALVVDAVFERKLSDGMARWYRVPCDADVKGWVHDNMVGALAVTP